MSGDKIPKKWVASINPGCRSECPRLSEVNITDMPILEKQTSNLMRETNLFKVIRSALHLARRYRETKSYVLNLADASSDCPGVIDFPTDMGKFPLCGLVPMDAVARIMHTDDLLTQDDRN